MTDDGAGVDDHTVVEPAGDPTAGADPFLGPEWSGPGRRRRSDSSRRGHRARRGRRRLVWAGLAGVTVAVLAALAWLLYTGLQARTQLEAARADVRMLRSDIAAGDLVGARAAASHLRTHADRARELTTGPLWATAAAVPWAGDPLDTTRAVTASVADISDHALPALVDAVDKLDPATLRRPDGSVDVAAIETVAPALKNAAAVMSNALTTMRAAPGHTWLGSVNAARDELLGQLTHLTGSVQSAETATAVLPPLLGMDRPQTYFVAFQNEAELRGVGGLPGAFAILRADHGKLRFVRFEPDGALNGASSGLSFDQDYQSLWPGDPGSLYVNSTMSMHFPYAARIWAAMWQRKSGQHVDGAIAIDPTTLSYLLAVTGPATLPDRSTVSSTNIVDLTQRAVYARFHDQDARKNYLLALARSVSTKLIASGADATGLVKAAARAVGEHRLLVWTSNPAVETRLAPLAISGVVPELSVPYVGLDIVNTGANKLDYYLHASLTWVRTGCGATRDVTVTIRLRNDAPAKGLPAYVLGGYFGKPGFPTVRGESRTSVYYYASGGAQLVSATHNGNPMGTGGGRERGHPVIGFGTVLPLHATQTFVIRLREPGAPTAPTVRLQPMINPATATVHDAECTS
jgi:hypothetical protein